ncbi:MAG: double-strand break repair helicase AddA [Rhodothalassiaceae bacterium]
MREKRLTSPQIAASDPKASVWVTASAGTGKTHVLTARLLRLMLEGTPPENILCLTFTRAAAAEMANRLRETLGRWTRLEDVALDANIDATCGIRASEAVRARARRLFAEVLELEDGMHIDTIHAFCQALLARFPLEAGLSPQFEVIDERQAADLLAEARDHVLVDAANRRALALIAREVNEEDFAKLTAALIGARRRLRHLLRTYSGAEGVAQAVRRALGLGADEDERKVIGDASAAAPIEKLRRLATVFATHGGRAEQGVVAALNAFLGAAESERPARWPDYAGIFLRRDGEPRSTRGFPTKDVVAAWPEAADVIAAEIDRVAAVETRLRLLRAVALTAAAMRVGEAILHRYEIGKAQAGTLDYDDLIEKTEALLRDTDMAPWVLYKLDHGIDHVLVDEAQDTNRAQWRIIEALTAEFFAGTGARELVRTVFAVGDVKQSIFAFQGAEPAAFAEACKRVRDRALAADTSFDDISLKRSFRSTRAVLALVDAVFADQDAARGLGIDPDRLHHEAHRAEDGGLIELWPVEEAPPRKDREPWELPLEQEPADNAEARLARRIASRIDRMLKTNEILDSADRPIRPGDIWVLVRRRTAFVRHLVKALKALEIPVAGNDRMVVTEELAVRDLLALAAFTLLPEDDLNLAAVLKGPFVGASEEDLFALAHGRDRRSLWSVLRESKNHRHIHDFLHRCLGDAGHLAPFEFFARVLNEYDGRRRLVARLGPEVIDPVDEFLRLARDDEGSHPPSLQEFVHRVTRGGAEVKRDPEQQADEVRIMTVHGAKGLEAPIVFLPDCCSIPDSDTRLLALPLVPESNSREPLLVWPGNSKANAVGPLAAARKVCDTARDEEYRRLLYVALTRACDRLYVAGWTVERRGRGRSWYEMVADGFDRLEGVETVSEGKRTLRRFIVPQKRRAEPKSEVTPPSAPPPLPAWARKPAPAEPTPPRPLAPSHPVDEEPPAASPRQAGQEVGPDPYRRGLLVHRLLELLPELPPEERRAAAQRFLAAAPDLVAGQREALWREVAAILEDAEFAPLFAPGSLAEVPLAGVVAGRPVSGQVDRLAVEDDRVLVVDYKTHRRPPARIADVPRLYLQQMAAYRALLAGLFPDRDIRCALLWTSEPRLMPLPDTLLDSGEPAPAAAP